MSTGLHVDCKVWGNSCESKEMPNPQALTTYTPFCSQMKMQIASAQPGKMWKGGFQSYLLGQSIHLGWMEKCQYVVVPGLEN